MNFLETVHYSQKNGKSTCTDKITLCRYKDMRKNSMLTRCENKSSYILLNHYSSFE